MSVRVLHYFFLLLLGISVFSCSKDGSEEAAPTSPVVGRWDYKSHYIALYDADGGFVSNMTVYGEEGDYNVLTADKRFEVYENNVLKSSGTYTYENNKLTLIGAQATTNYDVKSLTSTNLSLTADARKGKAGMFHSWEYVKH